ncbi:MAG: hypothetical protein ABW022_07295 [Actinoplanes sp.]
MPNINVYVSEAERPIWDAARRVANKHRISLNRVLADALRNDLRRADTDGPLRPNDEFADIAADAA